MLKFIFLRIIQLVPVLLAAITLCFFLTRMAPGSPFSDEKQYPEETLRRINEHYGLNDPIAVQYVRYLKNVIHGNLGPSLYYKNRTVNDIISETFPTSLELGLYALIFALILGLASGITASLRPDTALDHASMSISMAGICIPSFVLGPLLILFFSIKLGWFNASGWETPSDRILPTITLGAMYAASIARLSRGSLLEILPRDFIRTARAKGVSEANIVVQHALKNAILPVVSFLGPATASIITGSFVVESIFQIPGMGKMFVTAAFNRDYFLMLGLVVFYAGLLVIFNLIVDLFLGLLDPRVRIKA